MPASRDISPQLFVTVILFCFILVVGFMQRIDSMYLWQSSPDQFLVEQEPMLANLDGYYYLNIAREIQQGSYSTTDSQRAYPDLVQRSANPPLLSFILAYSSTIFHKSLNWSGVFTPALLGVLLALPLFLFGFRWGGAIMGLTAPVIGLLAPIYASRTSLAVLDTDCLNVTFSLTCAYLFMRFATHSTPRRYLFLATGLLCSLLFLWWWDQSPAAVTALALSPLCIGLIFFYRPTKKEGTVFIIVSCISVILLLTCLGWQKPLHIVNSLMGQFSYISKQAPEVYPNIGRFITEQDSISATLLMIGTALNIPVFITAIIGLIWLAIKKQKEVLFLMPILAVGLLSLHAMRFAIFLSPIIALGFGFFISSLYVLLNRNKIILALSVLLVGFLGWQGFQGATTRTSYYTGQTIAGMQQLNKLTPENAVIWSWWDEGHPLVYWADRPTINDGMVHGGRRTHYTALPLSTDDFRMAANFMQFYAARGMKGITTFINAVDSNEKDENQILIDILSQGPKEAAEFLAQLPMKPNSPLPTDLLEFFYPSTPPPIYLFLDKRLLTQAQFIYWYGTWDTEKRSGTPTLPVINLENIPFDNQGRPLAETFTVDLDNGIMEVPTMFNQPVPLHQVTFTDSIKSKYIKYLSSEAAPERTALFEKINPFDFVLAKEGLYELDLYPPAGRGILQDSKQANTIINRLFWRKNETDSTYFNLIDQQMPYYQIWKVNGDKVKTNE